MAKSRSSPPSPSCSTPPRSGPPSYDASPPREPTSSTGGGGVSKSIASPPTSSFASVSSPEALPSSLGESGGGGDCADHSAFRSNDARGGISGLLGAKGEIPVIAVDTPSCPCPCPAATDSPKDAGKLGATGEVGADADSGGSSSMWIKS